MTSKQTDCPLPTSVVIIGAGASGLFAARRFKQLGVQKIILIEKGKEVGGKCSTYSDPQDPNLKAERGAVVIAPNYGEVIDALNEKGIKTERTLEARSDTVEIISRADSLSGWQSIALGMKVLKEVWKFNRAVRKYRKCVAQAIPVPAELEIPFENYAKIHGLENINVLLKPFVSGFGYGDMKDCPTYSVLEYMGYMTIPFLIAQHYGVESCELRSVEGGFQRLMKALAEDFTVLLSTTVEKIHRKEASVEITYRSKDGQSETLEAEALVLALSPVHWEGLFGSDLLTDVEKECIDQLTYYRYPVIISRLHGLPPNYFYKPEMLNKEHFGHVAFVSTLDKRENPVGGRLCSAYINMLPHHKKESHVDEGSLARESIIADLKTLPGVTHVDIVESSIWEDYFPSLPWETRLKLEGMQFAKGTRTIYLGSYTLGCFEDVACVAEKATQTIDRCFQKETSTFSSFWKHVRRFCR